MDKDLLNAAGPDKWGEIGGLSGLVIWALFLMLAVMIWVIEKKLSKLEVGQETIKTTIIEKVERARSNIIEKLYESGLLNDRRKRDLDIGIKRRLDDDE